jgi:formylglycine-generating enzyme required for sulfatase activity
MYKRLFFAAFIMAAIFGCSDKKKMDSQSEPANPVVNEAPKAAPITVTIYEKWPFDAAEARRRQEETAKAIGEPIEKDVDLGGGMKMKMVLIPAGEFVMGSPKTEMGRNADEGPRHKVQITRPFYICATEVTQAQWKALMEINRSRFQGDDLPVETVSWDDCQEFLKILSAKEGKTYRLPTESEWEYACRAGTTTPFNTGETISTDQANYDGEFIRINGVRGESREKTTPAGSLKPNAWGLYDMHGNVWEWCQDWYGWYSNGDQVDPSGAAEGDRRVSRGGSWLGLPKYCRSALRFGCGGRPDGLQGFRVVWSVSMTPPG